jgi:NADPH-dependent 2,4-dienoyl-CoA reductase/sulfur reductase-like enzyme
MALLEPRFHQGRLPPGGGPPGRFRQVDLLVEPFCDRRKGGDMTVLILGASVAGTGTARELRRCGFAGDIIVLDKDPHQPYDRPPLSKGMLAAEGSGDPVLLLDQDTVAELAIDLRLGTGAVSLNPAERLVTTSTGEALAYDHLVIATGAKPRTLAGARDLDGVYTLRTVEDAQDIRRKLDSAANVVVIGAGFIGAEVAAAAHARGLAVVMVELQETPMAHLLGPEIGALLSGLHTQHGVDLQTGVGVAALQGQGSVNAVELTDGRVLPADLVVVGIGVLPETNWLETSGLPLRDGVVCDAQLRVEGHTNIYAAGDIARFLHPLYEADLRIEHWTNAQEHASIVAAGITNQTSPTVHVPYVWSDQYERRIQIVGRPMLGSLVALSGGVEAGESLTAVYADADGLTVAAVVVDDPRTLMKMRKAITRRLPVVDVVPESALLVGQE